MRDLPELAVTPKEAAFMLKLPYQTFCRYRDQIKARHGLCPIVVGKRELYNIESMRNLVRHCEKTGEPLYETDNRHLVHLRNNDVNVVSRQNSAHGETK